MKVMKSILERARARSSRRGSALLVSLMVLVGLSLLGLGFVTISETESAIAVNQRNALQTKAIAEAGARSVVEWFQSPRWAESVGIMPANNPAPAGMKRTRTSGTYTGVYKPTPTDRLFSKPYRPAPANRFYGDDDTADITINDTIAPVVMTNLNAYLFGTDSRVNGRISEIKMYAPPMVGGNLVGGFWVGGERYGTATIKVTSQKWSAVTGGRLLSSSVVRIVVGEFPLPIPAGPIQTASNAQFGGSFDVHWGMEAALGNLNPSVTRTRLPYANAFERPHFERAGTLQDGYDPEVFRVIGGSPYDSAPYLSELLGKSFADPWAESRARGTNTQCGTCGAYAATSVEGQPVHAAFQNQTATVFPTRRAVTFPTIQYNIWKRIALQGRGQKGVYYFSYVAGTDPPTFKRNGAGTARGPHYWVNTRSPGAGLGPGFYFFDTRDGSDPQLTGGGTNTAVLTPGIAWNSPEFGGDFLMVGFIYFNLSEYRSTGGGNSAPSLPYNMPGETWRDVGFRRWSTVANDWALDAGGNPIMEGAGDGGWGFQDLNGNGRFDLIIEGPLTMTSNDPGASARANQYKPKVWNRGRTPACTVPPAVGAAPATACSEPHEPYLNFIYPAIGSPTDAVTVGWELDGAQTRRPRDLTAANAAPNCGANPEMCTSNQFDRDGALVNLPAILNGVMYNEGTYSSQGNVDYFGSVLIKGNAGATGNAQVWFDEKLIKGNWAPPGMPNVIIYSEETDENN